MGRVITASLLSMTFPHQWMVSWLVSSYCGLVLIGFFLLAGTVSATHVRSSVLVLASMFRKPRNMPMNMYYLKARLFFFFFFTNQIKYTSWTISPSGLFRIISLFFMRSELQRMIITHNTKFYIDRKADKQEEIIPTTPSIHTLRTVRLTVCSMLWCVSVRACREIVFAKIMQTCTDEQSTTNTALESAFPVW